MEKKNLVPLVQGVCPIVKKTKLAVKEQKRQERAFNEENNHKSIFEEGALKRANEISGRLKAQPAVAAEEFER